jgi:cystathionine beta-lyase/cystathionine gamma-synthase
VTREKGIATIMDNTYSTPLYQNPIAMGVDIVVHSATKYIGGHSDLTAGAICTTDERMQRMIREEVNLFGSILAPFQAWLLTRGLRTLALRLKQHETNGNAVAGWLSQRPEVEQVNHVSLPDFPQRGLFTKQMRGSGGLFSIVPRCQDGVRVVRFVEALNLFSLGVSWGGFESLVVPIQLQPLGYDAPIWIVRFFCGLEDAPDLIADIERALAMAEM